jgi:hypothetical protein
MASLAAVYASHLSSEARSVGDSFPLAHRVDLTDREPGPLFGLRDREPQLGQADAVVDQHLLEQRDLAYELLVLIGCAEAHDPLDARPVVPGSVEQHDLARGRQVVDVALEVPLGAFAVCRLLQRDDARTARVEVLHEPLDGSALASRVTTLEHETCRSPLAWLHFCSFSSSICSSRFCSSYSERDMRWS